MTYIPTPFDRVKLDPSAAQVLSRFIDAFPEEKIFALENSEEFYTHKPDNDYAGGWVLQWLCPKSDNDFDNVRLHYAQENPPRFSLVLRWDGDHEHFYGKESKPDIEKCLARIEGIFTEKVWSIRVFREYAKWGIGTICKPDEIDRIINEIDRVNGRVVRYIIKSWRGTYDKEVDLGKSIQGNR